MNQAIAVPEAELERAAKVVAELEHGDALGALVYDVASRQAEGGTLFCGEKFMSGRAEAHGVEREAAETALGNVLGLLERGPETAVHWALFSALFVRGFCAAVRAREGERKALCAKLAAHCDFLELSSPYRVLAQLPRLGDPELTADVHTALGELVLRDDAAQADVPARARNAGRIAALGGAWSPSARAVLERIERDAADAYSRALAAVALGRAPRLPEPSCRISGRAGRFPRGPALSLLSWLTGFALLRWIAAVALATLGFRRDVDVELCGDAVRVRRSTRLLGRLVRSAEQLHPIARLGYARRAERYPALYFVLGAFSFALGLLLAGVFAFDAVSVGDPSLWAIAGMFLLAGAGLDLVFGVIAPGRRGRVALDLDLERKQRVRITGVPLEQADALLSALARKLARSGETERGVA